MSKRPQPSMTAVAGADDGKDAAIDRVRQMQHALALGRRKPLCEGGTVWFRGECGQCDAAAATLFAQAQPAAPAAPAGMAVPEGWKLVPVEPTTEMLAAADEGDAAYTLRTFGPGMSRVMQGPYDHWVAMLAAVKGPSS